MSMTSVLPILGDLYSPLPLKVRAMVPQIAPPQGPF